MVCFGVVIESMGHHVDGGGNSRVLNCENISCGMLLTSCIAVEVIRIWKHVAPAVPRMGFSANSQAQRRIRKVASQPVFASEATHSRAVVVETLNEGNGRCGMSPLYGSHPDLETRRSAENTLNAGSGKGW